MYSFLKLTVPFFVLIGILVPVNSGEQILPPLKQFQSGVVQNQIQCKHDLKLVIKETNLKPYCVNESSIKKMIIRGWAMEEKMQQKFLEQITDSILQASQSEVSGSSR